MTKAVLLPLGFIFLLAAAPVLQSQTSPTDTAVNEAVLRQSYTIVLRQKLVSAKMAESRGELVNAAKLYQEATNLAQQIGSGVDLETAQAISGLARTRLALARQAQSRQDLIEADKQINQVLKVDPHNPEALALKRQNDQMILLSRGTIPDTATMEQIPVIRNDKVDAGTLVQDGKLLYEMGKLEDAEVKLKQATVLDPDNVGAYYYLNLIQQAQFSRAAVSHTEDTAIRMQQVEKQWVLPKNPNLGISNPYAETNLVYTGPGRQEISSKLDRIRLDNVSYDSLPLSEVLRDLSEKTKVRDPEKIGINFLINPNADLSSSVQAAGAGGFPGGFPGEGRAAAVDPATGLPQANPGAAADAQVDVGSVIVKLNLSNIRLTDLLDAIVLVADHPIKYSIQDFAIVFSSKSADAAPLFMRTFKVDANTFFQGLESVNSTSFGASATGSSGSGGGGGGGGGSGNNQGGAVIPVVDMSPGASQIRATTQGGGGGGGATQGGGGQGATGNFGGGGAGGAQIQDRWAIGATVQNGGVNFLTIKRTTDEMSLAVKNFFSIMGVNLNAPKAVFFNDRLGLLFVKATESDLDTIERAIETLNQIPPQVHIKSRFIEVEQDDSKALGFDWYLGQFGSTVVAQGGTSPSLNTPGGGTFPGVVTTTANTTIQPSTTDQLITGGLQNSGPTVATITGILTNPNFQVAIHALEQRQGVENLAEPEVTTTSGRQTQMRATTLLTVIIGVNFQQGQGTTGIGGATP